MIGTNVFNINSEFAIRMSRSRQNNRNKVNTQLWDTLYVGMITIFANQIAGWF